MTRRWTRYRATTPPADRSTSASTVTATCAADPASSSITAPTCPTSPSTPARHAYGQRRRSSTSRPAHRPNSCRRALVRRCAEPDHDSGPPARGARAARSHSPGVLPARGPHRRRAGRMLCAGTCLSDGRRTRTRTPDARPAGSDRRRSSRVPRRRLSRPRPRRRTGRSSRARRPRVTRSGPGTRSRRGRPRRSSDVTRRLGASARAEVFDGAEDRARPRSGGMDR